MLLIAAASMILLFPSCDDDPVIPNEEELITTLIWTFTPVGGGTTIEQRFTDLDGDGGNAPVITTAPLLADTDYNATVRLLNESENPAEEITDEIEMEKEEHQFFFATAGGIDLTVDYSDMDADNLPVGLTTFVEAGSVSTGTVTVTLRHEPDKSALSTAPHRRG